MLQHKFSPFVLCLDQRLHASYFTFFCFCEYQNDDGAERSSPAVWIIILFVYPPACCRRSLRRWLKRRVKNPGMRAMTSLFCIAQLCTPICACILMSEKKNLHFRGLEIKAKERKRGKIWSCLYVNQKPKQTHQEIFWNILIYKVLAASEMKPLHRVSQEAISVSKSGGGLIWPAFTLMLPTLHKMTKSHEEVNRIDFPAAPSPRLSDKEPCHKLWTLGADKPTSSGDVVEGGEGKKRKYSCCEHCSSSSLSACLLQLHFAAVCSYSPLFKCE